MHVNDCLLCGKTVSALAMSLGMVVSLGSEIAHKACLQDVSIAEVEKKRKERNKVPDDWSVGLYET